MYVYTCMYIYIYIHFGNIYIYYNIVYTCLYLYYCTSYVTMYTEICITSRSHDQFGAAPQNGSIGGESRLCKKNEGIKIYHKMVIYII